MSNQPLQARILAAKKELSDAEGELRRLTEPSAPSQADVVAGARSKLSKARDLVAELSTLLAASELDEASEAVADAERNLSMVLDDLLAPSRTTIAPAAVLEALHRLDMARVRLGEIRDLTRSEE